MRLMILIAVTSLLSACATFTDEKVMKIQVGMNSDEIIKMFGKPDSVSTTVCGTSTPDPWKCTTWSYYNDWTYKTSTLTFKGHSPDPLLLNNFDINR